VTKSLPNQGSLSLDHYTTPTGTSENSLCDRSDDDQVTRIDSQSSFLSLDHDLPKNDQVTKSLSDQGSLSPDHQTTHTGISSSALTPLKLGDWVELLTGYFAGRQVEVVGFPPEKPGWVEIRGKGWAITYEYLRSDLWLIRRAQA
jgi:hypothetical protein